MQETISLKEAYEEGRKACKNQESDPEEAAQQTGAVVTIGLKNHCDVTVGHKNHCDEAQLASKVIAWNNL